jgi:hypothetical protein
MARPVDLRGAAGEACAPADAPAEACDLDEVFVMIGAPAPGYVAGGPEGVLDALAVRAPAGPRGRSRR